MADKNKNNYLWIGIAVVVVIVLAIVFISNSNNNSQNEVTCNSPYIKVGTSCCLDQNSNGICDSDEQPTQTQQETEIKKCEVKYDNSELQGTTTYCEDREGGSNNIADPVHYCKSSDRPYSYTYLYKTSYYCDSNDLCEKKEEVIGNCREMGEDYSCMIGNLGAACLR